MFIDLIISPDVKTISEAHLGKLKEILDSTVDIMDNFEENLIDELKAGIKYKD